MLNMNRTGFRRLASVSFFAALVLLSYRSLGVGRFEGRIIDDKTGKPLAATVVLTDGNGKPVEIDGKHGHVEYLGKRRCYVDGRFAVTASPGRLRVEIRHGLETFPLQQDLDLPGSSEPMAFRLRRWIDMRAQGYMSGDTHVHFLSQSDSHLQMRAEDLNVLNLLVSDFTNDRDKFSGRLDAVSTPDNAVFVGQESRDWQNGHVILLGIREIVEPFQPFGGKFQERNEPNLLMARILREARQQGGVTT